MKTLAVLVFIVLGTIAASAQVKLASADVSLTSTGTTTIINAGTTGTLNSVACTALGAPTVALTLTLQVSLDGGVHTTSYSVYSNNYWFDPSITPFLTLWNVESSGYMAGANQLDTFVLPLNVAYTSGLKIDVDISATSNPGGTLTCSVLHT